MATSPTKLITFAEFEQLPDPAAGRYKLIHGELRLVPPPKRKHYDVQSWLRDLLASAISDQPGRVGTEFAFRPHGDRDYFVCDVAWVSYVRWEATDPNSYFQGAPELVVEILSPSNTAAEMIEKEQVCLATGARESWIVDDERRLVKVSTPDGHTVAYRSGNTIPLFFAEGTSIAVDAVFG